MTRRTWVRVGLAAGAGLIGVPLLLAAALVVAVHQDGVATWLAQRVAAAFQPWPDAEVRVGYADVRGFWNIEIRDLRAERPEAGAPPLFVAERIEADLDLLPLLRRRVEVRRAHATGVALDVRQQPDSTWDLLAPFASGDTPEARSDEAGGDWRVRVGEVVLDAPAIAAHFLPRAESDSIRQGAARGGDGADAGAPPTDSGSGRTLRVDGLTLHVRDVLSAGRELSLRLDTLSARVFPPERPGSPASFDAAFALHDGRLEGGLLLRSDSSEVSAGGVLRLPGEGVATVHDVDFHVSAVPLDFRDVSALVPAVDVPGSLRFEARVRGSSDLLRLEASGRSFDGATLSVDGELTPRTEGSLRYRLDLGVRDLSPGRWTESGSPVEDVDVALALDLAGPSLDQLDGTAALDARAGRLGGGALEPTRFDVVLEAGRARFEGAGAVPPWGRFVASGEGTPFEERPAFRVHTRVDQLEPLGARGGTRLADAVLVLEAEGRGVRPDDARGSATLRLSATVGETVVENATARAQWADERADGEVRVALGEGSFVAALRVAALEEGLRVEVPEFRADRLDLPALLGERVTGTLSVDGDGELVWVEGGPRRAHVEAVLETARWGSVVVDTGRVAAELRNDDLTAEARVLSSAGILDLVARGRPLDPVPTFRVERLGVAGLDLSAAGEGLPASSIDALLWLEGAVPEDARNARATGALALAPSTVGPERVDTAEVRFSFSDGALVLDGEARTLGGSLRLLADGRPLDTVPSFRLERLAFDGLRPDTSWVGPLEMELTGTLTGEALLVPEALPRMHAELRIDPGPLGSGGHDGARLALASDGDSVAVEGALRTPEGLVELHADLRARSNEEGSWTLATVTADAVARLPDLHRYLDGVEPAALDARVHLTGTSEGEGARPAWAGTLQASGALAAARFDTLHAEANLADGVLRLDTLLLTSNVLRASGGGAVALDDSVSARPEGLRVLATLDSLHALAEIAPIRPLALRSAWLDLRLTHPDRGLRAEAVLDVGGAIASRFGADTVSAVAVAMLEGGTLVGGTARFRGNRIGWDAATFESIESAVAYDSATGAQYTALARRDDTHEVYTAGLVDPRAATARVDSLRISLPEDAWNLRAPATLTWGERISPGDLTLVSGESRIAATGSLDTGGVQNLGVELRAVRLGGFADLLGLTGVQGRLDGDLAVLGPAEDVFLRGALAVALEGVRLEMSVDSAAAGHAVSARMVDLEGGFLDVRGTVPLELSFAGEGAAGGDTAVATPAEADASAELAVTARSFRVDWATPIAAAFGVEQLAGILQADARIRGRLAEPLLDGEARLVSGVVRIPEQGVAYGEIHGALAFAGDRIRVDSLRAVASGTATLRGEIVLDPWSDPGFELTASLDRFRAADNRWTRLGVSGEVAVGGRLSAPVVEGEVRLADTDIRADAVGQGGRGAPVELTPEDYAMLEAYFGYRPEERAALEADPLLPWAMDVTVTLGSGVWLRRSAQPEMRIELGGSLDVAKEPGDSIQLFGTIEIIPQRSYFEELGRRFQVAEGTVTFNGSMWGWMTDMQATYDVPSFRDPSAPEVTITLAVQGGMEDLEVTLGSDPAMETADILSYLATGRPAESAVAFGSAGRSGGTGDGVVGVGTSLALGQVTGALEEVASESTGLDVVEIRQQGSGGATLVAGRYVSERLFVGFQQPLSARARNDDALGRNAHGTEVQLEYSAFSWLLMSLQGGESTLSFFLRTKHVF